jgi:NADPH:quinone reductase-like Zn-dependent oxidoreductase
MKAFVVARYGEDGLHAADMPKPAVGDGDLLVKVAAEGREAPDRASQLGPYSPSA